MVSGLHQTPTKQSVSKGQVGLGREFGQYRKGSAATDNYILQEPHRTLTIYNDEQAPALGSEGVFGKL